ISDLGFVYDFEVRALLPDLQSHGDGKVIAVTPLALMVRTAKGPRPVLAVAGPDQRVHRFHGISLARPAFVVEQSGRNRDLVENEPLPLIKVRAPAILRILSREEVEQQRIAIGTADSLKIPGRVQVLRNARRAGGIVEVATD